MVIDDVRINSPNIPVYTASYLLAVTPDFMDFFSLVSGDWSTCMKYKMITDIRCGSPSWCSATNYILILRTSYNVHLKHRLRPACIFDGETSIKEPLRVLTSLYDHSSFDKLFHVKRRHAANAHLLKMSCLNLGILRTRNIKNYRLLLKLFKLYSDV